MNDLTFSCRYPRVYFSSGALADPCSYLYLTCPLRPNIHSLALPSRADTLLLLFYAVSDGWSYTVRIRRYLPVYYQSSGYALYLWL